MVLGVLLLLLLLLSFEPVVPPLLLAGNLVLPPVDHEKNKKKQRNEKEKKQNKNKNRMNRPICERWEGAIFTSAACIFHYSRHEKKMGVNGTGA